MSGLEVVGVVLGSIPLVISALEHYGHGLSTLQRWRKYERELKSLIRNLGTEQVKLQNVCEKLLDGLVSPSKIEAMINHPFGDMWKEEDTRRKIRVRLWKGFDVFEVTIGDIRIAVDKVKERIDSQRGGKVSSEFKRAVFTFSRTQYDDLLKTIREGVSNLENLTDRNRELEPARKERSQGRFFMLLRDMSRSLYRALRSSLNCSCGHDLSLRLEKRSAAFVVTDKEEEILRGTTFKLALSSLDDDPAKELTSGEIDARCWEEIGVTPVGAVGGTSTTTTSQLTMDFASLQKATRDKTERRVGFVDAPVCIPLSSAKVENTHTNAGTKTNLGSTLTLTGACDASQRPLTSSISLPIHSAASKLPRTERISSLCKKMQKMHINHSTEAYGTIADLSPQTTREYTVYPLLPSGSEEKPKWSMISLREILDSKDDSLYLPYHNRLQIAVVISSSILQLYGSPWLPEMIQSRDITFVAKHGYPVYEHPLIMPHMGTNGDGPQPQDSSESMPYNTTLLSLGILLVELIVGNTDPFRKAHESASESSQLLMHFMTAHKLLDQDQARMPSPNYEAAVRRCLGGLPSGRQDLEKEDYCQNVYSGVVALLEKDLEYVS